MSYDRLEREIVETLIKSFETPFEEAKILNDSLLNMIAKYKSRVGEDSWMQRQYNEGAPDPMKYRRK